MSREVVRFKDDKLKSKIIGKLGEAFHESMKEFKAILAGGAILSLLTNQPINDYDIYFKSVEDAKRFVEDYCEWCLAFTDKAVTFEKNIAFNRPQFQAIISSFHDKPEDLFDTFDFAVCMVGYDFETETFIADSNAQRDIMSRQLTVNTNTSYPLATMLRILKYQDRGYSIDRLEMMKLGVAVGKLDLNNPEVLREQIGGYYQEEMTELAKEVLGKDIEVDFYRNVRVRDALFEKTSTSERFFIERDIYPNGDKDFAMEAMDMLLYLMEFPDMKTPLLAYHKESRVGKSTEMEKPF